MPAAIASPRQIADGRLIPLWGDSWGEGRKQGSRFLVMYAGLIPHLFSTKGIIEQSSEMWPFATGNSLYLDIDFSSGEDAG
jgi:hypothetical protein